MGEAGKDVDGAPWALRVLGFRFRARWEPAVGCGGKGDPAVPMKPCAARGVSGLLGSHYREAGAGTGTRKGAAWAAVHLLAHPPDPKAAESEPLSPGTDQ